GRDRRNQVAKTRKEVSMYDPTAPTTQQRSVLASLRALAPPRPLYPREALNVAQLQANRLLEHFQIESPAVPEEIISELPRIKVLRESLPVSGSAHWNGRYWIITVNGD